MSVVFSNSNLFYSFIPSKKKVLIWGYHDLVHITNHIFLGFRCNTSDSISAWCSLRSRVFLWQRNWKCTMLLFSHSVSSETVVSHSTLSSRALINITQNRTKDPHRASLDILFQRVSTPNKCSMYSFSHLAGVLNRVWSWKSCWTLHMWHILGFFLFSKLPHGLKHGPLQQILLSIILLTTFQDYSSILWFFSSGILLAILEKYL